MKREATYKVAFLLEKLGRVLVGGSRWLRGGCRRLQVAKVVDVLPGILRQPVAWTAWKALLLSWRDMRPLAMVLFTLSWTSLPLRWSSKRSTVVTKIMSPLEQMSR